MSTEPGQKLILSELNLILLGFLLFLLFALFFQCFFWFFLLCFLSISSFCHESSLCFSRLNLLIGLYSHHLYFMHIIILYAHYSCLHDPFNRSRFDFSRRCFLIATTGHGTTGRRIFRQDILRLSAPVSASDMFSLYLTLQIELLYLFKICNSTICKI